MLTQGDEAIVGWGGSLVRVFETQRCEPIEGFDAVPGRDEWHAVGSREPYVRSLTATADGVLLANVHVGGIARSTNSGGSWEPTIDIDTDVHQVVATDSQPGWVLAASAQGLAISTDRGITWQLRAEGLHATYMRAVATSTDIVLVSASSGPSGQRAALYRAALKGERPFERCRTGLP
jgi:hypothetical protein